MRFEITGDWKEEFEHDGMLYCAQRIEEMLMGYTSHLYKPPVYNSFLLAYEYLYVYNTVQSKSIDFAHLNNVLEEFIDSFSTDIVIKKHFSQEKIQYFCGKLKGISQAEQRKTMQYLLLLMENYPNWCVEALKESLQTPREKKKIEKALKSYISMLIGMGYHPQHIYRYCLKLFKNPEISNMEVFETFFKHFDGVDQEFLVYYPVDKRVSKFKEILDARLGIEFGRDEHSKKLRYDGSKHTCLHVTVTALDVNGAAKRAYENINLFIRYYKFLGNRDEEWCGKKCLVINSDGQSEYPYFGSDRYFYSKDFDDRTLGINSEHIITKLIESARGNDFVKIDKIIQTHNTALTSPDINNAFLNLWSVLEIISVDLFASDTSKIKQVLNNIVPVLERTRFIRIVEELHDYLKGNISQQDYSSFLSLISEEGSEEYKIACFVGLKKYKTERKQACDTWLRKYPLIRSRIYMLYDSMLSSKKVYLSEVNRYGQRLIWHIQRLYRVRNSIIHSGEPDNNMVALVEHLHSYVDEVLLDIIIRITRSNSMRTVENVLMDAKVFIDIINKEYSKEEEFTADDIRFLMQ